MTVPSISRVPGPPQIGRVPAPFEHEEQRPLWTQLLAVFRDLSGAFDPFANDADPHMRALGRQARQRDQAQANDYFALGDMCARLTLLPDSLSSTYAAKSIAAYVRAGELDSRQGRAVRMALLEFAGWLADAAEVMGGYDALNVALLTAERVLQLDMIAPDSPEGRRLLQTTSQLREHMVHLIEGSGTQSDPRLTGERESRMACDQGQMLLRQN